MKLTKQLYIHFNRHVLDIKLTFTDTTCKYNYLLKSIKLMKAFYRILLIILIEMLRDDFGQNSIL